VTWPCPCCADQQVMGEGKYCDYCWFDHGDPDMVDEDPTPRFCDICKMGSGWPSPLDHTEDCPRRAH